LQQSSNREKSFLRYKPVGSNCQCFERADIWAIDFIRKLSS
jgi:hypothetical protein